MCLFTWGIPPNGTSFLMMVTPGISVHIGQGSTSKRRLSQQGGMVELLWNLVWLAMILHLPAA
jgi:hypothetical protein